MHWPIPDAAPVTRAVLPSRRMRSAPFRRHAVSFGPAEAVLGARPRLIFAADKAVITQSIERREYRRVIDFAVVRFAARRHRGDLDMADQGTEFFEAPDQVAADNLHVIKIELDAQVGRADL